MKYSREVEAIFTAPAQPPSTLGDMHKLVVFSTPRNPSKTFSGDELKKLSAGALLLRLWDIQCKDACIDMRLSTRLPLEDLRVNCGVYKPVVNKFLLWLTSIHWAKAVDEGLFFIYPGQMLKTLQPAGSPWMALGPLTVVRFPVLHLFDTHSLPSSIRTALLVSNAHLLTDTRSMACLGWC